MELGIPKKRNASGNTAAPRIEPQILPAPPMINYGDNEDRLHDGERGGINEAYINSA